MEWNAICRQNSICRSEDYKQKRCRVGAESVSLLLWLQTAFGGRAPVRAAASAGCVVVLQHELLLHCERVERLGRRDGSDGSRLLLLHVCELRLLLRIDRAASRCARDERRARRTRSARRQGRRRPSVDVRRGRLRERVSRTHAGAARCALLRLRAAGGGKGNRRRRAGHRREALVHCVCNTRHVRYIRSLQRVWRDA